MSNMQPIKYANQVAESRVADFSTFLRVVLIFEALLALGMLLFPDSISTLFSIPADLNLALWGVFLLWTVAFQFPGLQSPVHSRIPVVIGIAGRFFVGLAYLFNDITLLGAVTTVLAVALGISLHRALRSVIDSRP